MRNKLFLIITLSVCCSVTFLCYGQQITIVPDSLWNPTNTEGVWLVQGQTDIIRQNTAWGETFYITMSFYIQKNKY